MAAVACSLSLCLEHMSEAYVVNVFVNMEKEAKYVSIRLRMNGYHMIHITIMTSHKINTNPNVQRLSEAFNIRPPTVKGQLVNLGLTTKLDCCVPHNLTANHWNERVVISISLLCR